MPGTGVQWLFMRVTHFPPPPSSIGLQTPPSNGHCLQCPGKVPLLVSSLVVVTAPQDAAQELPSPKHQHASPPRRSGPPLVRLIHQHTSIMSLITSVCVFSRSVVSNSLRPLWTIACQAPLSMGFSRQEYWSGLPCLPPEDLPNPGTEPTSPASAALQVDSLSLSHWGGPGHPCHDPFPICLLPLLDCECLQIRDSGSFTLRTRV